MSGPRLMLFYFLLPIMPGDNKLEWKKLKKKYSKTLWTYFPQLITHLGSSGPGMSNAKQGLKVSLPTGNPPIVSILLLMKQTCFRSASETKYHAKRDQFYYPRFKHPNLYVYHHLKQQDRPKKIEEIPSLLSSFFGKSGAIRDYKWKRTEIQNW